MSKNICNNIIIIGLGLFLSGAFVASAEAYWIWTSESGKWVNPKYAVKETPDAQFDWAMSFYEAEDYDRATKEFEKLVKYYPLSRLAAEAQFFIGDILEKQSQYYKAFKAYQKVVDRYPYSDRIGEVIEREYRIGNLFYTGQKRKLFGIEILPSMDSAIEVFEKVVDNAPFGEYAPLAQYKMGLCYKQREEFDLAKRAFEKVVEEYPTSEIADDAKYQVALCTMKGSLGVAYDQEKTDEALKEFTSVLEMRPGEDVVDETKKAIEELKEKKARQAYDTAQFYEKQKQYKAALIYYQEVVDDYPDVSFAPQALDRLVELKKKSQ